MENQHKQLLAENNYLTDNQTDSLNFTENLFFIFMFGLIAVSLLVGFITLLSWGIGWIGKLA